MKFWNRVALLGIVLFFVSCSFRHDKVPVSIPSLSGDVVNSLHSNLSVTVCKDSIKEMTKINIPLQYKIKVPDYYPYSTLDTIYKSYSFIPLETNDENLIGTIIKVLFLGERIVIMDSNMKNAFLFGGDGTFLCKLGCEGRGPGEHLEVAGITYDENNDHIILIDHYGGKFIHYTTDGKYIGEDPMFYHTMDVEFSRDRMIVLTGKFYNSTAEMLDLYQLVVADTLQKPLAVGYKTSEEVRSAFHVEHNLFKSDGKVFFEDVFSDTLFTIQEDSLIPYLTVKFDKDPLFSQEEIEHMTDELYFARKKAKEYVLECSLSDDYIFLTLSGNPKHIINPHCLSGLIYSKQSGKSKRVEMEPAVSITRLGDLFAGQGCGRAFEGNKCYRIVQPSIMLDEANNPRYKSLVLTPEEKAMLKTLTPESNPVLMIMEPVDF